MLLDLKKKKIYVIRVGIRALKTGPFLLQVHTGKSAGGAITQYLPRRGLDFTHLTL